METHVINLESIINSIRRHFRLITIVTLLAAVAGGGFFMVTPKKYAAEVEFLVRNPMYGDRTVIYGNEERLQNYFAGDDEIDKLIALSGSDIVQHEVIRKTGLAEVYKTDSEDIVSLERKLNKNLDIIRTEYGHMRLKYKDTDPKRAITVADEFVSVLDSVFGSYYNEMRTGMYRSVMSKIKEQDSAINALTDTLVAVRDRYGIYSSRYNLTINNGSYKTAKSGQGIEQITNTEMLKDALVNDRVLQITLVNRYKTGLDPNQLSTIKVISPAKIPYPPNALKGLWMAIIAGGAAFLFIVLIVLFSDSLNIKK